MFKKILLLSVFLAPVSFCADRSCGNELALTTPPKKSWPLRYLNPIPYIWRAIGYNMQAAENANLATTSSLRTAEVVEERILNVADQLSNSGVLLSQIESANKEISALRKMLLAEVITREEAERKLHHLLSQSTPSSVTSTTNSERDDRIKKLEGTLNSLVLELQQIKNSQSETEQQLLTFKDKLAAIIKSDAIDIDILLKDAEKMIKLGGENAHLAKLYRDTIADLQKEIEENKKLTVKLELSITRYRDEIKVLRAAARQFEGNGYTALFDIIENLKQRMTKEATAKAEQEIIAHITYTRLLAPSVPFRQLMELDGQEMWIDRLLGFCKYTDCSDSNTENAGRFFSARLSGFLIDGDRFVRYGGRSINYDKPKLDSTLLSGGLLLK